MFKTTKRIIAIAAATVAAAPCAAVADIPITKHFDKSSPNLYLTAGSSTAQPAQPAK